jgi:wobble nucleotide-excising tRNase
MGRRTVVYGHNGSGKSTLADLLLSISQRRCAAEVVWEGAEKRITRIGRDSEDAPPPIAVFTRTWVEANLAQFLDGDNAAAIVTLGESAIESKRRAEQLAGELVRLREVARAAATKQDDEARRADQAVERVQAAIVDRLRRFDYERFTKNRYNMPRVRDLLRGCEGGFPDDAACEAAVGVLEGGVPESVGSLTRMPEEIGERLGGLSAILGVTPSRQAIAELESDSGAQSWVEDGLALHGDRERCLFCDGAVTSERRQRLAAHFDESWLRIRHDATALLAEVQRYRRALADWHSTLPGASSLAVDLQGRFAEILARVTGDVEARVAGLSAVELALEEKTRDPNATPAAPDWSASVGVVGWDELEGILNEHNRRAADHDALADEAKKAILSHVVGSNCEEFRGLEKKAEDAREKAKEVADAVRAAESELDRLRQEQFTTKAMADKLTSDLVRVYGKDHLSVAVTEDGKSYACRRPDGPATHLSQGERTTLSLLYFLRNLQDQQGPQAKPSERIVVVDDPSSSLDRESLFATHQWLLDALEPFGQFVILTHDFDLLRLFINSHRTAWGKSRKAVAQGDSAEELFPKAAFLEMFAAPSSGARTSRIGALPGLLLKNTSEYTYLFSMVMAGVADSGDHERLFLLPNAARRVLEVFASYKAPHLPDFRSQLESFAQTGAGEPFRDVYDFCNRYSHGEGRESADALDARTVHGQIRRCMEFLRTVDDEHFKRMCRAASIDDAHPLVGIHSPPTATMGS